MTIESLDIFPCLTSNSLYLPFCQSGAKSLPSWSICRYRQASLRPFLGNCATAVSALVQAILRLYYLPGIFAVESGADPARSNEVAKAALALEIPFGVATDDAIAPVVLSWLRSARHRRAGCCSANFSVSAAEVQSQPEPWIPQTGGANRSLLPLVLAIACTTPISGNQSLCLLAAALTEWFHRIRPRRVATYQGRTWLLMFATAPSTCPLLPPVMFCTELDRLIPTAPPLISRLFSTTRPRFPYLTQDRSGSDGAVARSPL